MRKYWECLHLQVVITLISFSGHWVSAQNCPSGRLGSNCSLQCHCLNGDAVCKDDGCTDLQCDFGWTAPPKCQTPCPANKFGLYCFYQCHCSGNDKCGKKNGNCSSGRCHPEWGGTACQQRLARLFHPPTVNVYGCQNVTVSWKAWTHNVDVGVTRISAYILKIRRRGNQEWRDVVVTNGTSNFTEKIPGLEKNGVYKFRVDILSRNEKTNITGPPGVPTAFVHVPCINSNFIQEMTTENDGKITFQMANKANGMVTYNETGIGDCLKINGSTDTQNFQDVEKVTLPTLPWKRYLVTVEIFHPYLIKYVQSVLTAETVPTGKVIYVHSDKITSDSVSLSWVKLDCSERGGTFVRYDVILTKSIDSSTPDLKTTATQEMITIERLESFTNYSVRVAFVNQRGTGNMSDEFKFKTKESVPDPPQFVKIESSIYTVNIAWKPSINTRGHLREYQVICSDNMHFDRSISITKAALKTTNANFMHLKPFTDYYIKIRSSTNSGWGPFSGYEKVKTKEGPPSAPRQIRWIHRNMTCLTLAWSPPDKLNGILKNYEVSRTEIFSYTKSTQESNVVKIKINNRPTYRTCNLLPATHYEFTIRAATVGGQGYSSEPAIFWTEIMSPAAPPRPIIGKISYTSADITLQPVVTYTGPVSWYEVRVQELATDNGESFKERKKRDTQKTSFELEAADLTAVLTPQLVGHSTVFTVGDNKTYGSVRNKPLSNRKSYRIYFVVHSSLNNVSKWNASSTKFPLHLLSKDLNQRTISVVVLVVIILAIALLFVLLLLVFCYRCRRNRKHTYIDHVNKTQEQKDDEALEKYWNATYSTHESRFIVVNIDFLPVKPSAPHSALQDKSYILSINQHSPSNQETDSVSNPERNSKTCPVTFREEFEILNKLPRPKYSFSEAQKIENAKLNRFSRLLPYDHSRVRLKPDSSSSNTYINASQIKITGYDTTNTTSRFTRTYIAAQSPFNSETMRDLWRMIYQQEVRVVVMLTKHVEDKIIKCSEYFPKVVDQSFTFDKFVMRVINVDSHVDFSITEILLELVGGKQINLYIFRLFEWPEKRPAYSTALIDMRRKVRQLSDNFPHNPMLVHCGTGNGRTGTFIAIDILLDEYSQHGSVNVFNSVKRMRECRPYMVRTFAQYLLIYDAIFEACQAGDLSFLSLLDLDAKCKQLNMTNWKTSRTYLEDQFTLLCFLTPKPNIDQIRTGLLPQNSDKHRYPDIIPPDEFRPQLTNCLNENPVEIDYAMYINAVFIDGYKKKGAYIVTQTPLSSSLEEFWCLIYEYDVRTIVMMDSNTKGDTCISYWKHPTSFKYFTVTPEGKTVNDRSTVHRLVLRRKDDTIEGAARVVHLFRFKCRQSSNLVPVGRDHMLDLIVDVNRWQEKKQRRPIVVHCKDGATNAGLFCTSDLLIQEMTNENCADVYHTVKKMKIRRPEMIPNMEQYKFCHSVIQLYVSRQKP